MKICAKNPEFKRIQMYLVKNLKNIFFKVQSSSTYIHPQIFFNSLFKLIIFNITIIRARAEPLQPINKFKKRKKKEINNS